MRKGSVLIILLGIMLLVPSVFAQDIEYDVQVDPQYTWYNADDTHYLKASQEVVIQIRAMNITGTNICDIANAFRIYGTGDVTEIMYTQNFDLFPGVERTGGFQPGGGIWVDNNQLTPVDMDGTLPDEFSFSGSACVTGSGWGQDTEMLTRFNLYLMVPFPDTLPTGDICIDSAGYGDPSNDWLFAPSVDVALNGPYCWPVKFPIPYPFFFVNAPTELATTHDVPFDISLEAYNWHHSITGASATYGNVTVQTGNTIRWTFDPPCDWAVDGENHWVEICVWDDYLHTGCSYIDLNVINRHYTFDGPFGDTCYAGVGVENHMTFMADDPDTQDVHTWTVTADPVPNGALTISDGVVSFTPTEEDIGNVYKISVEIDDCGLFGSIGGFFFKVEGYPICGDLDYSGDITLLDILYMIDRKFKHGPAFSPEAIGDVNNDGNFNLLDILLLINYKFKDGPALECPPF